jgi:photosystem II stability/assembly factor-like uncharacterized protein
MRKTLQFLTCSCLLVIQTLAFAQPTFTVVNLNTANPMRKIVFATPQRIFIGSNSGTVYRSNNGGLTWDSLNIGYGMAVRDLFFTDSVTGYATGGSSGTFNGRVYKTTNAGTTWTQQTLDTTYYPGNPFPSSFELYGLYFLNNNVGYVCGQSGILQKTTNGGATWTFQNADNRPTENLFDILFLNDSVGLSVAQSGRIFATDSSSSNWDAERYSPNNPRLTNLVFHNNTLFTVGAPGGSTQGGTILRYTGSNLLERDSLLVMARWQQINSPLFRGGTDNPRLTNIAFRGSEGVISSRGGKILYSANNGLSWDSITNPSPTPTVDINDVTISPGGVVWLASEAGILMRSNQVLGLPSLGVPANQSIQVYPNPTLGVFQITGLTLSKEPYTLTLTDLSGKTILQKTEVMQDAGTLQVDASALQTGIYLIRVQGTDRVHTGRIVKE